MELQRAALDEKSSVSTLLRKALVVASKLQVTDFEAWARAELEGYKGEVPEYRRLTGAPKIINPMRGYQDLTCDDAEIAEMIGMLPLGECIDALEKGNTDGPWMFSYNPKHEALIMSIMSQPAMKPCLQISGTAIRGVIGRVRTIVLDWSLTLEKQGIHGEGMTFTKEERARAQAASAVHIDTYISGVSGSQIQVHSPGASQQQGMLPAQLAELRKLVGMIDGALHGAADTETVRELRAEVATLKAQSESPKPKRSVIRESLSSVRAIFEGAAGEVLAHHVPELSVILPQATMMVHELLKHIPS
jgi:hypothetical protein